MWRASTARHAGRSTIGASRCAKATWLCRRAWQPFRKGIDGLALAVQEMFGMDPFCGAAFVFRAKRADRIKLLIWDQTGMVVVHKRLEDGTFVWPQVRDGVMRMSGAQFAALFEGVDWRLVRPERARRPLAAG